MATTLLDLPDEILAFIFALARPSARHVAQLATVCSRFHQAAMDDGVWESIFKRAACASADSELKRPDARDASGNQLSWRKLTRRITKTRVDVRIIAYPNEIYDPAVRLCRDDGVTTYALCAARTRTRLANLVLSRYIRPLSQFAVWSADVAGAEGTPDGSTDQQLRLVHVQVSHVLHTPKPDMPITRSATPWWWEKWSAACAHEHPRISIACLFGRTVWRDDTVVTV